MLPAIVIEQPPRLVRAIRLLAAAADSKADADAAAGLADELSGITAMVADKFTNDRTAEGIQRAQLLTVGGVSLGLESLVREESERADGEEGDRLALDLLLAEGAEFVFQQGFRLIRELAALPEDTLVGEYDLDPVYSQRRLKELFVDLCTADPGESWSGWERYLGQLRQREEVQAIVSAAHWLRRNHWSGPIEDPDLNAEGVIALAIVFGIEGTGRIVARTGQKDFERLVQAVRKSKPDVEAGWAALLERIPAPHKAVVAERIDSYRNSTLLQNIFAKAAMKQLFMELENFAGSEIDAEYP
jgi:ribosomal protein S7